MSPFTDVETISSHKFRSWRRYAAITKKKTEIETLRSQVASLKWKLGWWEEWWAFGDTTAWYEVQAWGAHTSVAQHQVLSKAEEDPNISKDQAMPVRVAEDPDTSEEVPDSDKDQAILAHTEEKAVLEMLYGHLSDSDDWDSDDGEEHGRA